MANDFKIDTLSLDQIEGELANRAAGQKDDDGPFGQFSTAALATQLRLVQKAIYGSDDRKDFWEFPSDEYRERSRGVAGLVRKELVVDNGDGTSTLRTVQFGTRKRLCESEPFWKQPTAPSCSAFLVAPDIVATAGHCIDQAGMESVRVVFGFRMENADTDVVTVPSTDIYRPVELLGRVEQPSGPDWAVVRIDRPAEGRPVARIRRSGRIREGANVYVMGHPSGLPIKYADGAQVRDNTPTTFFVANLDTYGGNSGSPVYGDDHVVEGILVRGEADFVRDGACSVSKICPTTGCRGEDCTRTTEFASLVPE